MSLRSAVEGLQRGHQHGAVGHGEPVDGLQAVPRPRLHALRQRVVEHDRHVDVLGLVAGHVLLELFLGVGDDGEVLGRDAVALRAVAVAPEGDAPPAGLARRQHDAARDAGGEVLLEDAAVHDLDRSGLPYTLLRESRGTSGRVVRPRRYSAGPRGCQGGSRSNRSGPAGRFGRGGRPAPGDHAAEVLGARSDRPSARGGRSRPAPPPAAPSRPRRRGEARVSTPAPTRRMRGARMKTISTGTGRPSSVAVPRVSNDSRWRP